MEACGLWTAFARKPAWRLSLIPADPVTTRPALTVSALNRAVAGLLERSFPLVRVQGEICNLTRAASGHWYFGLKDDNAQVRCVMFRGRNSLLDWRPRDGDDVEATAIVSLYEARGEFQLTVEFLRRAGLGRLYEEFLKLKQRLAAEGLFDRPRRPLPRMPRSVGVMTSLQAAALRDVLSVLQRRAPYLRVVIYPVPVQGAAAGGEIATMLERAAARAEVDVLLLVRGGGSIEDLWAFNEEVVARAIRAASLPVIVGVGHDSDVTIADFVADVRAPTPTAAAELVAPDAGALRNEVAAQLRRLVRQLVVRLEHTGQRVDYAQRSLATPRAAIAAIEGRITSLRSRSTTAVARGSGRAAARLAAIWAQALHARPRPDEIAGTLLAWRSRLVASGATAMLPRAARFGALAARLAALDPRAVLDRGYAIVLDGVGRTITDAARLAPGDHLRLVLSHGSAGVQVETTARGDAAGSLDQQE